VWYLCESGRSCGSDLVSLVPRNVGSDPELKIDGNRLVGAYPVSLLFGPSWGLYSSVCLGHLAMLLIDQSSASHRYLRLLNQLAMISLNDGTM
jgi:hypothetical protein